MSIRSVSLWTDKKAAAKASELYSEVDKSPLVNRRPTRTGRKRKRKQGRSAVDFVRNVVHSPFSQGFSLGVIILNMLFIAIEAEFINVDNSLAIQRASACANLVFIGIYLAEFLLKIYSEPWSYWANLYNQFDVLVLVLALAQWIVGIFTDQLSITLTGLKLVQGLRAIRGLRIVGRIQSLQVVSDALVNTLRNNVADIIVLMLMIMFIFGVMGHYLFSSGVPGDWGSMGSSLLTLWIYVCADGWLPYQEHLSSAGYTGSQAFTVIFIFIGNFIISNLFIAVVCQNIDDATEADRLDQMRKRREKKLMKRDLFLKKQRQDMSHLIAQQGGRNRNFQELLQEMVGTLRHEDIAAVQNLGCSLMWFDTFIVTLHYHENSMYRIQQTHFGIANCLAEYVDRRLQSRTQSER
ncbi:Ion transport protein-domain-containing protein [Polychytrium aggregatum]|uniref:Ion transport protein-domain-containing protein n=1 Tax=Polychytrium aggregatum TaxID=110093 RepID=UPI0022FDE793|nr:Ion transport protein-domain-containing protein [Polychytrium aggregatum]KAI9209787.1 Ion transport protein-domain-containing protein [Polychytrium aggregatum]